MDESRNANDAIETNWYRKNWFILRTLVTKDFKLRYRRSVLGIAWSVLNPLLMMVVLTAVFSFMFRFSIENFPLYLILGNILFALMADSTGASMDSIINSSALIKKIRIEKLVFPLESTAFQLVNFAVSLIAVAIVMIYFQIAPTVNMFLLPVLLIYVMIFSLGLGMLLAALSVFFRDVRHLWGVVLTAWTYATPLFWPVDLLEGWMMTVEQFNPMYHYVTYFRDIMMWNITPSLAENGICFAMAIVTFIVGFIVFRKSESKFILYI